MGILPWLSLFLVFALYAPEVGLIHPVTESNMKHRVVKREKLIIVISPLADCFHLLIGLFYLA